MVVFSLMFYDYLSYFIVTKCKMNIEFCNTDIYRKICEIFCYIDVKNDFTFEY